MNFSCDVAVSFSRRELKFNVDLDYRALTFQKPLIGHGYKRQILHNYNIHAGKTNVSRSHDCLVLDKELRS